MSPDELERLYLRLDLVHQKLTILNGLLDNLLTAVWVIIFITVVHFIWSREKR